MSFPIAAMMPEADLASGGSSTRSNLIGVSAAGLPQQLEHQPPQNSVLGINESPVLPPVRPEGVVPRPLGDTSPPPPPMVPSLPASGAGTTN